MMRRPVLMVDGVEAAAFWRELAGFDQQLEVPPGDAVVFVGLVHGGVEIT